MLSQVPATDNTRKSVTIVDLARARDFTGIKQPPTDQSDLDAYAKLFNGRTVFVVSSELFTAGGADLDAWRNEAGFSLIDVDRTIDAGEPPNVISVVEGRIDKARVIAALRAGFKSGATVRERNGERVVSVGPDNGNDLTQASPVCPIGESVRAAGDDGRVRWARSNSVIDAAIDTGHGAPSLADDDDFRAVARVLDDAKAYQTYITGSPEQFTGVGAIAPPGA